MAYGQFKNLEEVANVLNWFFIQAKQYLQSDT